MYLIVGSDRSTPTLYRGVVESDELRIPLHRFTVKQLHRMRETGVLAPRTRVELLDGILVDMHRPSARELEATRRIAGILAEHFAADVVAGEPAHPDSYATFDATIMVHDWEQHPLTAPYRLHRFSLADFDRMLDIGILPSAERLELLDGVVLDAAAGGPGETLTNAVAMRLPAPMSDAVVTRRSAVELGPYSRLWVDLAVCRPRSAGYGAKPASGDDVLIALDVVSQPELAQRLRWPLYARWSVTAAWIVDVDRDEILTLRRTPLGAGFTVEVHRLEELLGPRIDARRSK